MPELSLWISLIIFPFLSQFESPKYHPLTDFSATISLRPHQALFIFEHDTGQIFPKHSLITSSHSEVFNILASGKNIPVLLAYHLELLITQLLLVFHPLKIS